MRTFRSIIRFYFFPCGKPDIEGRSFFTKLKFCNPILLACLLLGFGLLIYLHEAPNPYKNGVESALRNGKKPRAKHYAATYLPKAAKINLVLLGVLALASPFIWRMQTAGKNASEVREQKSEIPNINRIELSIMRAALAMSLLLTLYYQLPRMTHCLWGDEQTTMRRTVVGDFKYDADNKMKFYDRDYFEALWNYKSPNNHMLFSLVSQKTHSIFGLNTDDKFKPYFREWAMRLPSILATISGLFFLYGICRAFAWSYGFAFAGLYLSLHPWFIRYGSEARGYAMMLCMQFAAMFFLQRALRNSKWRDWLAYTFLQTLLFLTYPGIFHIVFFINVLLLLFLLFEKNSIAPDLRVKRLVRFGVSAVFAIIFGLQMILPLFPQMQKWLGSSRLKGNMGVDIFLDCVARIFSGIPWHPWSHYNPNCNSWFLYFEQGFMRATFIVAIMLGLFLWSLWHFGRRGGLLSIIGLCSVYGLPLIFFYAKSRGFYIYEWYSLCVLPYVIVMLAGGFQSIGGTLTRKLDKLGRSMKNSFLLQFIAIFIFVFYLSQPGLKERKTLRDYPSEPNLESVHVYRQVINPHFIDEMKHVISVQPLHPTFAYDPAGRTAKSGKDLEEIMLEADAKSLPLFVNGGNIGLASLNMPLLLAYLNDDRYFEQVAFMLGMDSQNTRRVFRYRAGSMVKLGPKKFSLKRKPSQN